MAASERRGTPGGVAIVGTLAVIVGVFEVIGGVLMVIFQDDVHGYSSGNAVVFGVVTIVVGLIYLWVGRGLIALNPLALTVGLFVSGFRLVYDIVWLIAVGLDGIGFVSLITVFVNLLIFLALWSGRRAFAP